MNSLAVHSYNSRTLYFNTTDGWHGENFRRKKECRK